MLSISQSLPGLNATNMAILVGDKLRGALGSIAAIIGMCLPGGVLMYVVGILYRDHGDRVWVTAGLKGVAAAAVGLILFTVVQLSEKSLQVRLCLYGADGDWCEPFSSWAFRAPLSSASSPFSFIARRKNERGALMNQIPALIRVFSYLSLLTVGGGMAAFPETEDSYRRRPQVADLLATDSSVQHWADGARPQHDDDCLHRAVGGRLARCSCGADRVFRTDRDPRLYCRSPVEEAGKVAVAEFDSEGISSRFHWPAAGGLFQHGQRRHHRRETAALAVAVLLILLRYKINPALLILAGAVVGVISFMPSR